MLVLYLKPAVTCSLYGGERTGGKGDKEEKKGMWEYCAHLCYLYRKNGHSRSGVFTMEGNMFICSCNSIKSSIHHPYNTTFSLSLSVYPSHTLIKSRLLDHVN